MFRPHIQDMSSQKQFVSCHCQNRSLVTHVPISDDLLLLLLL
jgi:hypothetical protein